MKKCTTCNERKEIEEFTKNRSKVDGLNNRCKLCQRLISKKHYRENKQYYLTRNEDRRQETLLFFNEYKELCQCCFCNEKDSCCLDFHHVNPQDKEFAVSDMARGYGIDALKKEISKCIVVCANCHRKIHADKISPVDVVEAYQSSKLKG